MLIYELGGSSSKPQYSVKGLCNSIAFRYNMVQKCVQFINKFNKNNIIHCFLQSYFKNIFIDLVVFLLLYTFDNDVYRMHGQYYFINNRLYFFYSFVRSIFGKFINKMSVHIFGKRCTISLTHSYRRQPVSCIYHSNDSCSL